LLVIASGIWQPAWQESLHVLLCFRKNFPDKCDFLTTGANNREKQSKKVSSEKEQFIQLIREHRKIIFKIIHAYCKDPADKQDLEQEILIQLWKSLKSYDHRVKLSTWLYRVALNVAISHYRKSGKKREKTIPITDAFLQLADDNSTSHELESQLARLHGFINQLGAFQKALMILYLDGHSYQQIAAILGISETNVGTKLSRIKRTLKEKITTH
jgi:RNA polymerase sigma factor (sigma-70 family)